MARQLLYGLYVLDFILLHSVVLRDTIYPDLTWSNTYSRE